GIMGAAQRGAGRENSFGLNIRLPFEQRANEIIHGDAKLINFNYFFTRKLNFVKETHAFALFPGGFGTMDEGFEALTLMQTGKALIQKAEGELTRQLANLLRKGEIVQGGHLPQEQNQPEMSHLPRLIFTPHRDAFGGYRQLIDAINRAETAQVPGLV